MLKSPRNLKDYLDDQWVLVIEPTLNYRNSIKSFLTNLKVTKVKVVSSVKEARRELLTLKVGFFIVEWGLSEINGIQFCRELRSQRPFCDIPFLLVTVENLKSDVILAAEVGIDGYLLKPFSYEDFADTVTNIVKARQTPSQINHLLALAEERLKDDHLDEALELFKAAAAENERSARARWGIGRVLHRKDDKQGAVAAFKSAIDANPEFIDAYRELVELYMETGQTSAVHATAQILHEKSPDNPRYTLLLAKTCLERRNLEEAEQYFKKTIRISPKLADAYKGLGKVNMMQEDYQSAMKNFQKALDLDHNDVSLLNSLGLAYIRQERFADGIDKYRMALKLRPHDPRILFNLGYAKEKIGDIEQAEFYYRQALTFKPKFKKALRRLSKLREAS